MKKIFLLLVIFLTACGSINPLVNSTPVPATNYYVAVNGSDSNAGTLSAPFATLNKASSMVTAGSIVYVRGGTYNQLVDITKGSGTSDYPVTYKPYNDETVIIDGTGITGSSTSLVDIQGVSYVYFDSFVIRNSSGRCLNVGSSLYVEVDFNIIHDCGDRGIGINGNEITAGDNTIYNVVLQNKNDAMGSGGWAADIDVFKMPSGASSQSIFILDNNISDSWGEGVGATDIIGAVIDGNTINNVWSVSLYLSWVENAEVDNNIVNNPDQTYWRGGYPAAGLSMSAESCCVPATQYPSHNITIQRNLFETVGDGLRYWDSTDESYDNLNIQFNDWIYPHDITLNFDNNTTSGNVFENNIIEGGFAMPNVNGWTFQNNDWPTHLPSFDNLSISVDPEFTVDFHTQNPAVASMGVYAGQSQSSTLTPTTTPSYTPSPSHTASSSATFTPSPSKTPSPTNTATFTPTSTPTQTPTATAIPPVITQFDPYDGSVAPVVGPNGTIYPVAPLFGSYLSIYTVKSKPDNYYPATFFALRNTSSTGFTLDFSYCPWSTVYPLIQKLNTSQSSNYMSNYSDGVRFAAGERSTIFPLNTVNVTKVIYRKPTGGVAQWYGAISTLPCNNLPTDISSIPAYDLQYQSDESYNGATESGLSLMGFNAIWPLVSSQTVYVPFSQLEVNQLPVAMEVVNTGGLNLHLRSCASTSCSSLALMPEYSTVTYLSTSPDGLWAQVVYNGQTGWASLAYLEVQ